MISKTTKQCRLFFILVLPFIASGCIEQIEKTEKYPLIKQEEISPTITRIENAEVICYVYATTSAGGISCKWKSGTLDEL
jgi:hypothetical protein